MADDLFRADGRTDRHDESKSFFEILRTPLKWRSYVATVSLLSVAAILAVPGEGRDSSSSSRIMAAVGRSACLLRVRRCKNK